MKYVTTKVFKRLEANNVRSAFNEPPKSLLLPVSLGVTSTSLLHILDEQYRTHLKRSGHANYTLHVLFINHSPLLNDQLDHRRSIDLLKERFPLHTYTILSLEDVFDYEQLDIEKEILGLQSSVNLFLTDDKRARLQQLMSNLPSETSRADLTTILRQTLTAEFAKQHGCEIILYGDSTTRLAERTLSETAKGRGGLLPWLTADVPLIFSGLRMAYPMRDLLKKEISIFAAMISPPLTPLIHNNGSSTGQASSVSSRSTTIDQLMCQYFESVEQNYPSIVANVVRTSSKLKAPSTNSNTSSCNICKLPVMTLSHYWGGDQNSDLNSSIDVDAAALEHVGAICYGCARSIKTAG